MKNVKQIITRVEPVIEILSDVLGLALEYIESFLEKLEGGAAIILEKTTVISEVVDAVTKSLFFAHRSNNNIFENAMNGVVSVMGISMGVVVPLVTGLNDALDVLDGALDNINRFIKAPFELFEPALEPARQHLGNLEWIKDVVEKEIRFSLPGYSWYAWSVSMEGIANLIEEIKGWLWWLSGLNVSVMFIIFLHHCRK